MRRDLKIRGYIVAQFPNPPLWIALGAILAARFTNQASAVNEVARGVFYVALTIWAYEEAAGGVNGFRRALGSAALVLIVVALARAIR